jgi:hypothetical protein
MNSDDEASTVARSGAGAIAVGAAACVACCAGPILAALGTISVATTVGYLLAGTAAILTGVAAVAVVVIRRRRRRSACAAPTSTVALLDAPTTRQPAPAAGARPAGHPAEPSALT